MTGRDGTELMVHSLFHFLVVLGGLSAFRFPLTQPLVNWTLTGINR